MIDPTRAVESVPPLDDPSAGLPIELDDRTRAYVRRLVPILDRQTGRTAADNALEREDTVQEVFVQLLESRASGVLVQRPKAFVDLVARGVLRNVGPMKVGSTDRQAIIKHSAWRRAFTYEHGHEPSRQESDAAAVRLREEWPDRRHRPSQGFHKWAHAAMDVPASLDLCSSDPLTDSHKGAFPECLRTEFADQYRQHEAEAQQVGRVNWAELAEACLSRECFAEGNKRQARILLYPALAQTTSAPIPNLGSLGRLQVQAARAAIERDGGVALAIESFGAGGLTEAVEALFAPWRDQALSHSDRLAILAVLAYPGGDVADLWESALKFASREQQPVIERLVASWLDGPTEFEGGQAAAA